MGLIWIWWNQGITRNGSWSLVHRAPSAEPGVKTSCGAVTSKGTHHKPMRYPEAAKGPIESGIACMRCMQKEGLGDGQAT
jgi:hypothetical protein